MGALESKLLKWSSSLESWQQDLLRKIATHEEVGASEYAAYAKHIEHTLYGESNLWIEEQDDDNTPVYEPLSEAHLQSTESGAPEVRLTSLTHVEGANNLKNNSTLEFEQAGLTIIAGKNGSGKSGYTRLIKQLAASRAPEIIMENAFHPGVIPKAQLTYKEGDAEAVTVDWKQGDEPEPSPLQRVRVFDSRSATVHVTASNEVAYLPPALLLLADYTQALKNIQKIIHGHTSLEGYKEKSWPNLARGQGQEIFEALGTESAKSLLEELRELTAQESEELAKLPQRIQQLTASDPAKLAVQAQTRSTQLSTLARNLQSISKVLSDENLELVKGAFAKVTKADEELKAASKEVEGIGKLENVGSNEWRSMWEAASEFHDIHSDTGFPDLTEGAVCELCQQELSNESKERMRRYAELMQGKAQEALRTATNELNEYLRVLNELSFSSLLTQGIVELVGTYDSKVGSELTSVCASALRYKEWAEKGCIESDKPEQKDITTALNTAAEAISKAAAEEDTLAKKYSDVDSNALQANLLRQRQDALELQRDLSLVKGEIIKEHDRRVRVECLKVSGAKCDTTQVSRQNTALSREYIDEICVAFTAEATILGLDRVPVELVFDRSSLGISYIKIGLKDAANISAGKVLSEGEQRVTAIAGFFADLAKSGDNSTLVFDDPVSSLDQEYREQVARRLLVEAKTRQVLVFTHDFPFVRYIYEQADLINLEAEGGETEPSAAINYIHIARGPGGAGTVTDQDHWRHVSVGERIKNINKRIEIAQALYTQHDDEAYDKEAKDIVGSLRETWEYFVEQELLSGVVVRHDRTVQTRKLRFLTDISSEDVAKVDAGMTVGSKEMTGHDKPASDGSQTLNPDKLREEVRKLKDFRSSVISRRNSK